jgi:hypothetical protein
MVPPAPESSGSPLRLDWALLLLAALFGCASGDAPWDVAEGDEARFRRAQRECRILTEDTDGNQGPIPFDECMNRRGFDRMGPIERLFKEG